MSTTAVARSEETMCDRLRTLARGTFDKELTAATRELVREMSWAVEHGVAKPKGKVTITVDFTLDRGMMDVVADFATKLPKKARGRTVMFPGPGGELLAEDPKQMSLELERRGDPVDAPTNRAVRAI